MNSKPYISVIIPTLNEAKNLEELLPYLYDSDPKVHLEIIVVDGGSKDDTVEIVKKSGAKLISSPTQSRAFQLNLGAAAANADVYYFLHADSRPCLGFIEDILNAVESGMQSGCYRYQFDSKSKLLKLNGWFTRFNGLFAGGGDQTLFITRSLFEDLGGYDENFVVMEDFDLVRRIRKVSKFKVLPKSILVSARKYHSNSWLKVQLANAAAMIAFHLKIEPRRIKALYFNMLNQQFNSRTR